MADNSNLKNNSINENDNKYDKVDGLTLAHEPTKQHYFSDGQSTFTNNGFFIHSEDPNDWHRYYEYATTSSGGIVARYAGTDYLRMDAVDVERSNNWLDKTDVPTSSLNIALNRCYVKPVIVSFMGEDNNSLSISAPDEPGYEFMCWLTISTIGYVQTGYFENPLSENTKIWANGGNGKWKSNMQVKCMCLMRCHDF